LWRIVDTVPGAVAAALVDEEGETVDYAGDVESEQIKLAGAYMSILLNRSSMTQTMGCVGPLIEIRLRAQHGQFVSRPLGLGYQVTVLLEPTATLPKLDDALDRALVALRIEAGGVLI
jgi:predicted regulator of Ras-like GTPase activity (Roadblock/LC7/MglB family)